MRLESKKVLITVKAYPNPSKKYTETVCCAGIDLESNKWIRLYPIPFRDLDESQKFKKYTVIELKAEKSNKDHRPESFRIDSDSISIIEHIDTRKKWQRRKEIIMPTISSSFCSILDEANKGITSLGMFQPCEIDFHYKKANIKDIETIEACYAQLTFFDKKKKAIEQIPFDFYYSFKCRNHHECPGHKLLIIDWEIGQAYRDWRHRYKSQNILLKKIKEKWLTQLCADSKDVYFFVGNMQRFPQNFMILGVFYPPK
ncbi:MAG: hypothetical protein JW860_03615 [Sedimentisphaerales bacterium]|nr:hypothetical protein [Sedimentisphaerales bacterium]